MSTLKEISQEHMSNMSEQFFKHFVKNYNGRTFTMDDLVNDEVIKGCIITKKQVPDKKVTKTKSNIYYLFIIFPKQSFYAPRALHLSV